MDMTFSKRVLPLLALAAFVAAAFTLAPGHAPPDPLEIGSQVPMAERAMTGTDGQTYTLGETAGENGLLVIFSCNTCPWVKAWEDRYNPTAAAAEELGIGMIAVNPNTAIRDRGESMADMKARAEKSGYAFPYVLDKNAKLAEAFGATRTPDVFLFNEDLELVYRGAIDDNAQNADAVENPYLANAMKALAAGSEIEPNVTKSLGCEIKYGE